MGKALVYRYFVTLVSLTAALLFIWPSFSTLFKNGEFEFFQGEFDNSMTHKRSNAPCHSYCDSPLPLNEGLLFPIDQFDQLMYVPRQSTASSKLDIELEAILRDVRDANFEPLERLDVNDSKRALSKPVGLLKVAMSQDYMTCTASVIDENKILTNWHCLPKYGDRVTHSVLQMGFYSTNSDVGVKTYSVHLDPIEANEQFDYTILKVDGDLSPWGQIKLDDRLPPARRSLTVVHHPAGLQKHITERNCRTADSVIVNGRLAHLCDTVKGSSGAPIFHDFDGETRMVALHFAGIPSTRRAFDPSYNFNQGIPLAEIIKRSATLKNLLQNQKEASANKVTSAPSSEYVFKSKNTVVQTIEERVAREAQREFCIGNRQCNRIHTLPSAAGSAASAQNENTAKKRFVANGTCVRLGFDRAAQIDFRNAQVRPIQALDDAGNIFVLSVLTCERDELE
ncbi:MAG: serine protease [Pseudomonadota bacterium]